MKKSLLLAAAALMISASVSAQTLKIIKNGEVVAEYPADESTSVVFVPAQEQGIAQEIAGAYDCYRQVTIPAMPQMGVVVKDEAKVELKAVGANAVAVTLPSCVFVNNGTPMTLPEITIPTVEVKAEGTSYTMSVDQYRGEADGREYTVDFSAVINADGTYAFTETLKYGSMPFALQISFSSEAPALSPAEAVAGVYKCNREVYIEQMLELMGILVKDQAEIKIAAVGEDMVSITVPPCSYVMEGRQMDMPGATIAEVKVEVGQDGYTMSVSQYQGLDEETQRTFTVDFSATIGFDGSFSFLEAMKYGSMPFTLTMVYTPEAEWVDLGMATYTDFFLSGPFGIEPAVTYEVPVQQNWLNPGIYRLVNAYGEACPLNYPGDYNPNETNYLVINCEDPDAVYIEMQKLGNNWSNFGDFYGLSYGAYYMQEGKTLEEAKNDGVCGTFKNGIITFEARTCLTNMPEYKENSLFYGNTQTVTCVLPGYSNPEKSSNVTKAPQNNLVHKGDLKLSQSPVKF